MADTPEKKVKRKVVAILKDFGAYYFYPVTGGFGASGVPDVIACIKGRFVGIEVKADMKKNKPTALQVKNLNHIKECGGISLVIDANNLDHLVTTLENIT